jgi:WhiB family redox-sensing transcriptional regulator
MTATLSRWDTQSDQQLTDDRTWDALTALATTGSAAGPVDSASKAGTVSGGSALSIDSVTPAHLRSDLPCQTDSADLWFSDTPAGLESAKALCGPCPLRDACLAGALDRREPWGVWGAEILERGVVIGRKRPRGRPRKVAA